MGEKMTLTKARKALKPYQIVITRDVDGEYRVNYRSGREATAYYTNDIDDAYGTGRKIAEHMASTVLTYSIDYYVNKQHVGTPDAEIEAKIRESCAKLQLAAATVEAAVKYGLQRHGLNRSTYEMVMSGR